VAAVSTPRRLRLLIAAASLAVTALATSSGVAAPSAACPASVAASAGPVAWVFSQLGAPSPASAGLSWSWTRGSGSWAAGAGTGTICSQDRGGGRPTRNLVLTVAGASTLSPQIVRYGLPGVAITLPVRVSATDDGSCPRGTRGTVTLFASYYSVHRDSIALRFARACRSHDHTFTGTAVHVEISRNGAQVNSA